ncbi:lyase family protein [uncultured Roseibium sp.]|uniref:lyase family protein n=1 Tax=uncultured Roseibium sp. TaxID=1936171 RepID=UPI00260FE153|nr:lyase family protein [uncultured Roseibium sp.]
MPVSLFSSPVYADLFADEELCRLLSDDSDVAQMIGFERTLAIVQGRLEVIPAIAAGEIEAKLAHAQVDPARLAAATQAAGIPVPALLTELRELVGKDAGDWLHWGATSQDVMDTAMMLQAKVVFGILSARLTKLIDTLQRQSTRYADVLMAGRTRSQVSTPITLGYRIAQWAHPLIDAEAALPELRRNALKVQFGGASGTNNAIYPEGPAVSKALSQELGLADSPSWHVNRTPLLKISSWLVQLTAALSKMAQDLTLLGRSDIGEVTSGAGGGSSTMPQKSNPVQAETIQVLHQMSITAEHGLLIAANPAEERDGAKWPLEWHCLPQLFLCTGRSLQHAQALAESLTPRPDGLSGTIDANPAIMAEAASFALAKAGVSRVAAKEIVAAASTDTRPFNEALSSRSPVEINWSEILDPSSAIRPTQEMANQIFSRRQHRSAD